MNSRAFWDIASCGLVEVDRVIVLMMEAVRTPKRRFTSTTPHGAISHKAVTFKDKENPV
jgi:hypothetical protein